MPPAEAAGIDTGRAASLPLRVEGARTPMFCGPVESGRGGEARYIAYETGGALGDGRLEGRHALG